MKKHKKLIIFDFDGVIIDSFNVAFSILKDLNSKYGLFELKTKEDLENLFQGNIWENYKKLGLKENLKKIFIDEFKKNYEKRINELKIFPKIKILLDNLAKNFTLAIISSNHTNSIIKILNENGLRNYISYILGADLPGNKKEKIKNLLAQTKIPKSQAYLVSDTSGDVLEAKEMRIRAIAITWGYHSREILRRSKPDKIINKVNELMSYFYAKR